MADIPCGRVPAIETHAEVGSSKNIYNRITRFMNLITEGDLVMILGSAMSGDDDCLDVLLLA